MSARNEQVGGDHYSRFTIQPRDIAVEYQLEYEEVQALKYLLRHRRKNGAEDIDKAIHCLQLLKERLYPVRDKTCSKFTNLEYFVPSGKTHLHKGKPGC